MKNELLYKEWGSTCLVLTKGSPLFLNPCKDTYWKTTKDKRDLGKDHSTLKNLTFVLTTNKMRHKLVAYFRFNVTLDEIPLGRHGLLNLEKY